ncbi:MAG: hypothetical protein GY854_19745 [Deltaproteobacteria bacterium]|nr:hypothetical protein [Deltaproteobacteria bacterium]
MKDRKKYALLRRLIYDKRLQTGDDGKTYSGMPVSMFDQDELATLGQMVGDGWVERGRGCWLLTTAGDAEWADARSNPTFRDSPDFVFEALTGCTSDGKQSSIQRAALPTRKPYRAPKAEENTDKTRWIEQLAKRIGCSNYECVDWLNTGQIQECPQCKRLARFSRRSDGEGWRSSCRMCRAREEQQRRTTRNRAR